MSTGERNLPHRTALVVTSISAPNAALRELAQGCHAANAPFILIGDSKSPSGFSLDGCTFYSIERQLQTGFQTAALCPLRHYARKNIGYLVGAQYGASVIVETDDDNFPRKDFWAERIRRQLIPGLDQGGWVNVYGYFSDANIWPRGLPLDAVRHPLPRFDSLAVAERDCPIQQGLADENPDVDAIYRLLLPLPLRFRFDRQVGLGRDSWCPLNSQNTTWWRDAYPLLYLPAYCSFRMTDIWRSLIAQRIGWENGWSVLFHGPTVWQERNDHNLMRDFQDEVPGYLHNRAIADALAGLSIAPGLERMADNLRICYETLVRLSLVDSKELRLLEAWLGDLAVLGIPAAAATSEGGRVTAPVG